MEKIDRVVAGLECCTERRCTKCPYLEQEMYCMTVLEKDALEVINGLRLRCDRLEAERDDLRKDVAVLAENLNGAQEMVSRLRRMYGND